MINGLIVLDYWHEENKLSTQLVALLVSFNPFDFVRLFNLHLNEMGVFRALCSLIIEEEHLMGIMSVGIGQYD